MTSIPPVNPSLPSGVEASRVNWKGIAKIGSATTNALQCVKASVAHVQLRFPLGKSGKQQGAPLKTVQGEIPSAAASHRQESGRSFGAVHVQ